MSKMDKIGQRIAVLREKMGNIPVAELEKGGADRDKPLLGNATISGWLGKPVTWTSDKLGLFLSHYRINPKWWETGDGDIFLTSVPEAGDNKEMNDSRENYYKSIFEGNTEYVMIPRIVLKDTKLVSIDQFEKDKRIIDKLLDQNDKLIARVIALESEPASVKKSKQNP